MGVFVDASAYISSLNKKDSNFKKALEISDKFHRQNFQFITSNIVIYEVYTVLTLKVDKNLAFKFRQIIKKEKTPIIYLEEELEEIAWQIFAEEKSKNVGFFDCTSFAVIEKLNINYVFSFDRDFERFCLRKGIKINEV